MRRDLVRFEEQDRKEGPRYFPTMSFLRGKSRDRCFHKSKAAVLPKDETEPTDDNFFGYYNLFPEICDLSIPLSPQTRKDTDDTPEWLEWIPAALIGKEFNPPKRPPGPALPTCLWIGVPILPRRRAKAKRRRHIRSSRLDPSSPSYENHRKTERYLVGLPERPVPRFYQADLVTEKLVSPQGYIPWMLEMKAKLIQCDAWRILEDELKPLPAPSELRPIWDQLSQRAWFMILANVSREIRRQICAAHEWDAQGSWCYLVQFARGLIMTAPRDEQVDGNVNGESRE